MNCKNREIQQLKVDSKVYYPQYRVQGIPGKEAIYLHVKVTDKHQTHFNGSSTTKVLWALKLKMLYLCGAEASRNEILCFVLALFHEISIVP